MRGHALKGPAWKCVLHRSSYGQSSFDHGYWIESSVKIPEGDIEKRYFHDRAVHGRRLPLLCVRR